MSLDPQQTAQLRAPVGPKASFDAVKVRGLHGYDETSDCPTICPGDGLDYKRSMVHPSDVPAAAPLSGSETITALQGSGLVRTTLQAIADLVASGLYQPLDDDLTAIAALSTQAFGRSLLEQASKNATRDYLGATSRSLFARRYTVDLTTTPVEVASFTIPAEDFNSNIAGAPRLLKIRVEVATQFSASPVPFVATLKANGTSFLSKDLTVPSGSGTGATLSLDLSSFYVNNSQIFYFGHCHTVCIDGSAPAVKWTNIELDALLEQEITVELSVSSGTASISVFAVSAELS